ncbi:sensor histidine kinase [Intestinibacter bartlettii]|uniref:histidine kinase n=1 Tax=Intestinibacter bartlettii TaxID=261299 RepID=A0ABS6DX21_9FIRM|nr:HAMP domain-containing sensor histidine kinase [Intestinibacter bartlettii]MBU5336396.1 HAMP domain-containing histidine kinase [Intestinibacter bartlettii]
MKFWKKIFLYSLILFLLLFNGGGIILIEKIHGENLNTAIKSLMYKYLNVQSVMYLNSDYLTNIDVDSESNMKNWMDIIINGYSINNVEQYNTELYSMENKEITSDLKQKILGKRQEILQAQTGKKVFIIRSINNKKYAFVSSIVNLENRDFKLIISRDIQYVYTERINNYKLFILIDFIILIILSIGMYIISKKLTNPIVNLSNISKDIAKGEYDIRVVESKKNDEIGVLEHNFNLMIDVIENNIEELKTLNESKQRFIDSLNHEIKTPITSIIGYSELLLKGNVSEEIKIKAYKYINSEAKRLETLNSTLLKLTLIREEKKTLKKVNLIEMINGVENILKYKLLKKDINLNIKIEDVNILADKELLEVLLTNLIDNSIKASSENSIIEIDGYYNNEKYILKIKDYGIGIPKEDLDKILEPFYMVDKARTRKNNGIGLGLSICSEICKIHNISLDIESELNMGTIVILGFDKENFYNEI